MPLHAYNSDAQLIPARRAKRQVDYFCIECQKIVHVRGGPQRQCHFYHIEPTHCRQHQKGPVHLQIQSYFLKSLPKGDCELERPFSSIRRIADVAWISQKVVFEIQYSPISAEEVLARNQDYGRMGWKVIWILHDRRFNQIRLTAAEIALRSSPYYYCNMDQKGAGIIYDQFDIWKEGMRRAKLPSLAVQINQWAPISSSKTYPLHLLQNRANGWKMFLSGDLTSEYLARPHSDYLAQAAYMEKHFEVVSRNAAWYLFIFGLMKAQIVRWYQIVFRFFLERMCR